MLLKWQTRGIASPKYVVVAWSEPLIIMSRFETLLPYITIYDHIILETYKAYAPFYGYIITKVCEWT